MGARENLSMGYNKSYRFPRAIQDKFELPKEVGSCPQYRFSVKWYYSTEEKACKPFIYLGCVGANVMGKNNFVTRKQCTSICKEKEKRCRTIVDVAFLIDSSGSIRRSQWPVMLSFVKKIIGSLEISPQGSHVAAVSYSTDPKVDFTFNSFTGDQLNQEEINNAIDSIRHMRGYTFIDKALKLVNQDVFTTAGGMRNAVKKMLFVFTDGFQTKNKPYTPLDQASKPIKDKGIDIWSVGIGRALNEQELKQMASNESNVITVGSFDDLQTILDKLRLHICKEPELTKCQTKHREALKTARPGDFIPQCKGDGSFENVQCHSMECYCVDQEGNEIYGTRARVEAGRPQCTAAARKATPCQIAYRQAVDDHVFGAHIPRCKSDGRYEEIQCEGRTGYCWCVDNDGRELPGTRTRRHLKCPHPDDIQTHCRKRYMARLRNPAPGGYLPWCNADGSYRWIQCYSTYCFCVDDNGVELTATRVDNAAGRPNCTERGGEVPTCWRQYQDALRNYVPGQFVPRCQNNGHFNPVQCHGSFCYCVNEDGQEIQGTKTYIYTGRPRCTYKESRGPALDIGFVMDSSASVNWAQMLNFAKWLSGKTTVSADGAHFGFIPYAATANIAFTFKALSGSGYTSSAVNNLIDSVAAIGGSGRRLDLALSLAYRSLFTSHGGVRKQSKKVLVIFIGGAVDAQYTAAVESVKKQLINAGIQLVIIDQGPQLPTNAYPDINTILSGQSNCHQQYYRAIRQYSPGSFIPRCHPDASYDIMQCQGQYCYCVNDLGVELPRTRLEVKYGTPHCLHLRPGVSCDGRCAPGTSPDRPTLTECQARRLSGVSSFIPNCKQDGSYEEVQCDPLTNHCWCVDGKGKEIMGTRIGNRNGGRSYIRCAPTVERRPLDLAILVDTSAQISPSQWKLVLNFVKIIVGGFDISQHGTHVALVPFSDTAKTSFAFNTPSLWTASEVNTYIEWLKQNPAVRRLDSALVHAENGVFRIVNGMRPNARKKDCIPGEHYGSFRVGVILGNPGKTALTNCERQYQEHWRNSRPGRYVPRCTIDGKFQTVQSYGGIVFCVDQNGIANRGLEVNGLVDGRTTCEQLVPSVTRQNVDLAFLFDGSASVSSRQFTQEIDYAKAILGRLNVAEGKTHVAAASYSTKPQVHFTFINPLSGASRSVSNVNNLLNNVRQDKGLSRIGRGLQTVDREVFSRTGGYRIDQNPVKILVVFVGGGQTQDANALSIDQAILGLRTKEVNTFVVGIGSKYDPQIAQQIASDRRNVYPEKQITTMEDAILKSLKTPLIGIPVTPPPDPFYVVVFFDGVVMY
ncbi:hypothetical protein QZH41_008038 [Actinostola sp. cb2023]|nr:hypothetical protein QZH41_008038 [Actinostola sp. cb2023]